MKLLQGGFAQLLPIVQWFVTVHLNHIEEAARGTLPSGPGGPSEEVAIECLLRIFEWRREEVNADKETLEAYMSVKGGVQSAYFPFSPKGRWTQQQRCGQVGNWVSIRCPPVHHPAGATGLRFVIHSLAAV